ncbi:hypothetical protein GCM10010211_35890 [Streptomyces albospinus]|uniref:Lipoprotein n=1 Tax=Streptomyces albospinus TaxID=285515 RepID=A0ABQ2V6L8_9ACTN|nr:hypothetical protein [Streptomyces albospinus]GGU67430.1 hypothetical protein GCM10010211_35890 [Streptomyces albospinus]
MSISARWAAVAAVTVLATTLAGCTSGKSGSDPKGGGSSKSGAPDSSASAPSGPIPVGPGPQSAYTVQKQPDPGTCHVRYTADKQPLPDPKCTPGATNPKVTPQTLKATICSSGYTKGIRPPVSITNREKAANAKSYGYTGPMHDAEYDHLISLQLGGDPNDPRNLWVEPPSPGHKPGAGPNNPKDGVENKLKAAICSGKADLVKAQQVIAHDWTTALSSLGLKE